MNHRALKDSVPVPNQPRGENPVPCEGTALAWNSVSASGLLREKSAPTHQKPELHDRKAPSLAAPRRCAIAGLRRADPVSTARRVPRTCNFAGRAFHISILEGVEKLTRKQH